MRRCSLLMFLTHPDNVSKFFFTDVCIDVWREARYFLYIKQPFYLIHQKLLGYKDQYWQRFLEYFGINKKTVGCCGH